MAFFSREGINPDSLAKVRPCSFSFSSDKFESRLTSSSCSSEYDLSSSENDPDERDRESESARWGSSGERLSGWFRRHIEVRRSYVPSRPTKDAKTCLYSDNSGRLN